MKKEMSAAWIGMFVIMFMTAFFTYPLFLKLERLDSKWKMELPELTRENYREYHELFEEQFDENIPYRDHFITCRSRIDLYGFRDSPSEEGVIGKENWLFYKSTIDDYKGLDLYSQEELEEIKTVLEPGQQYFNERGIEFIIFVAPNKATIYGEQYLPDYIYRKEGMSRTEQVVAYLRENTDINVVFPQNEMIMTAKRYPEYPLYLHKDTHWNTLGGYCGAKVLLHEMGKELPEMEEIILEENSDPMFFWNSFDLGRMIGLRDELPEDINYRIDGFTNHTVELKGDTTTDSDAFYRVSVASSDAEDDRKVMFIRDSFGTAMLPVLAAEFSEIYSPHRASGIEWDEMNPDIVIYEIVERGAFGVDFKEDFEKFNLYFDNF